MNLINKQLVKTTLLSTLCAVSILSTNIKAQNEVEVKSSIQKALNNIKNASNQWFRYQIEMEPNNGMPCCFQEGHKTGCSLEGDNYGWGSFNSSSSDAKELTIYLKTTKSGVAKMIMAGEECAVDTSNAKVVDLNGVTNQKSIEFLASAYDSEESRGKKERLISAIAYHEGSKAQTFLEDLLNDKQQKENAIFWLGAARNKAGYERLEQLLGDEKESRKYKSKAIFALSENSSEKAIPKLLEIARESSDSDLKGEALFWLAQKQVEEALPIIEELIGDTSSRRLVDKAIFALSQFKNVRSWNKLVDLATNHSSIAVREKSIFWLSQGDEVEGVEPLPVLLALTKKTEPGKIREQAVFAISQLDGDDSVNALVNLIRNSEDNFVKRKAIFWLGQSDNPKAIELIDGLFVSEN